MSAKSTIKIGGASGYWGESAMSTPQLLVVDDLDYIVYDYLAEITMSIMARARATDPEKGYALDFVSSVLKPNLAKIAEKGVKILSNAGGVNPEACGEAVRALIKERGFDLKVSVITGDDLLLRKEEFSDRELKEMFSGEGFPDPVKIASMNAYLGSGPIVVALEAGADIIITGRCADSALTLGACRYAFDWTADNYDLMAAGSLIGHLLECGPQATGGNYTDWHEVADTIHNIGYPIAEVRPDGSAVITKPEDTGGTVTKGTVCEQLVYEIEDPQRYLLPDVICDFSEVTVEEVDGNKVEVKGAIGFAPTGFYKVSTTFLDGFKAGSLLNFTGFDAADKARALAAAAFKRARNILRASNLGDFDETSVEVMGDDSQFGGVNKGASEVALKIAVRHKRPEGAGLFLKEIAGLGLATPAGLTVFNAGRPKPSPIVRLFSFLVKSDELDIAIDGQPYADVIAFSVTPEPERPNSPDNIDISGAIEVPLIDLAYARSGDKGNRANIGIIARSPNYLPYIWNVLDEAAVQEHFAHFEPSRVERFLMPGISAINFVLHDVLGGGGIASLRADAQGKAYGQILLHAKVKVPVEIANQIEARID